MNATDIILSPSTKRRATRRILTILDITILTKPNKVNNRWVLLGGFETQPTVMVLATPERKENASRSYYIWVASNVFVAIAAFHAGFTARTNMMVLQQDCPPHCSHHHPFPYADIKNIYINNKSLRQSSLFSSTDSRIKVERQTTANDELKFRFPATLKTLLVGMGRVNRDDFAKMFDVGVPLMATSAGNEEVLILYGDDASLPRATTSIESNTTDDIPLFTPQDATEHCLTMKMILLEPGQENQCLAIMGQWQAHMIHRWRRRIKMEKVPYPEQDRASLDKPLQLVSRAYQRMLDGPIERGVKDAFRSFANYATHMTEVLDMLRPIAARVVHGKPYNNTIVVTLCNHGQSELFLNFVCAARARGLDTSQVLLFATDSETKELADAVGVTAFYADKVRNNLLTRRAFHERTVRIYHGLQDLIRCLLMLFVLQIFGDVPKLAARQFGDRTFKQLVMTKVYCLHLIHQLGYNILYQDADVLWYKQPLEYFDMPNIGKFDMYFQDDGARDVQDEQYHANGGFFYIRNNKRTAYFLSNLVRYGEYIWKENEQFAINSLLNEHASFTGLRAKVLNREESGFPGGWNFHRRPQMMKDILQGKIMPYIFHMSWNNHKIEKRNYLEQMGSFFVAERCVGATASKLSKGKTNGTKSEIFVSTCCVIDPPVTCHYRDKPSKIPCYDSPPIDKGMPSFW